MVGPSTSLSGVFVACSDIRAEDAATGQGGEAARLLGAVLVAQPSLDLGGPLMEFGRSLVGGRLPVLCLSDGHADRGEPPLLALARVRQDGSWTLRSIPVEAPLGRHDFPREVVDPGHGAPGRDELADCPALTDRLDEEAGLADHLAKALGCELAELGFPARGSFHDLASLTPDQRVWRYAA
jgi:hypothetical protein